MKQRNIIDLPRSHMDAALGLAFEHGADPALAIDPVNDRIVDANPRAATLLGYPRADLRGARASALHPGQLPALIEFSQATLAKKRYWTHALSPRHADGRILELEYSAVVLPTAGGDWLLVTLHDIVERRRRMVDREADLFMRSGLTEWRRAERCLQHIEGGERRRAGRPADPPGGRRGRLRRQYRRRHDIRQPRSRTLAGLGRQRTGRSRHARHRPSQPCRRPPLS